MGANVTPSFEVFTFKGIELHGNLVDFADTLKPDLATHRIPKRDGARIEHMGQGANRFRFKVVFLGESARGNYVHLAKSIQDDPEGFLIHPLLGTRNVLCEGWDGASVNLPMSRETIEIPLSFVENALDPSLSDAQFVTVSERKQQTTQAIATFAALVVQFTAAADVAISLTSEATAYATAAEAAYNGNIVDPSTTSLLEAVATATDAAIAAVKADPLAAEAADCQPTLDAAEQVYAACVLLDEAVAADKPAIVTYTVPATMHVAAIAAVLYGSDGSLHIDEILTLNRVANPGAIPGGTVLRVSEATA